MSPILCGQSSSKVSLLHKLQRSYIAIWHDQRATEVAKVGNMDNFLAFVPGAGSNPKLDVGCQRSLLNFTASLLISIMTVLCKVSPKSCFLSLVFEHDNQPSHNPFVTFLEGENQCQNLIKFCSSSQWLLGRYSTCDNFPRVAKLGS